MTTTTLIYPTSAQRLEWGLDRLTRPGVLDVLSSTWADAVTCPHCQGHGEINTRYNAAEDYHDTVTCGLCDQGGQVPAYVAHAIDLDAAYAARRRQQAQGAWLAA